MHIIILSMNPKLFSTQRLQEEGRARGHKVEIIDPMACFMDISTNLPVVHYKKRKLTSIDAVIPRIASAITFYGMAIVRQFEMMGVYCINSANSIGQSRDKLRSLQLLSREGISLPKTSFASSTEQTEKLIKLVGGAPVVVKLLEGSQGRGVVLCETHQASESLIDAFRELKANFLVQEFVKDANGRDIRCFVVGDKVVASMMRVAKEGEFRSNIHRGGKGEVIKITSEERNLAIQAAKAMGLNMAGVDIVRSKTGPKILEVNSSPGLEGIEKTTGINVAQKIFKFIEEKA